MFSHPCRWLFLVCLALLSACNTNGSAPGSTVSNDDQTASQSINGSYNDNQNSAAILNNDGLEAPEAPTLSIAGFHRHLEFSWNNQSTDQSASLIAYNRRSGIETLIADQLSNANGPYLLPISSHTLAWHDMQYRVQICSNNNQCTSSESVPVIGLLASTIDTVQAESNSASDNYAHSLAINASGNVLASLVPGANQIYMHFELPHGWIQASQIPLFSNELSHLQATSFNSVSMSLSSSGDTLAVAGVNNSDGAVLIVFDRLGENWIQTAQFNPFQLSQQALLSAHFSSNAINIQLSDNGEQLLVSLQASANQNEDNANAISELLSLSRTGASWRTEHTLPLAASGASRLPAFSASADLQTLFTLSENNGDVILNRYKQSANQWQSVASLSLSMLQASSDIALQSSADGEAVLIGGWERGTADKTPVLWHYQAYDNAFELLTSIREPATIDTMAQYRLAADANLQHLAIGWQSTDDADLSVYYQEQQAWVHALSLPDSLNISAKSALAQQVEFSADGTTLLVSSSQSLASPAQRSGGFIRVFQ